MKLNIQKFASLNVGDTYETSPVSIKPYGYSSNAYQMKFTVKLNSQNTTNFTSNITITSYMRTLNNSWGWSGFSKIYMERYTKVNDETGYTLRNSTQLTSLPTNNANNWVNCGSWTDNVKHNSNGECTLYVKNHLLTSSSSSYTYIPRDTEQVSEALVLPQLHKNPEIIIESVSELNTYLTGVANNVFVQNLSKKSFTFTPTTYDSATATKVVVSNGTTTSNDNTTSPKIIDFTDKPLYIVNNAVQIKTTITDNLGSTGEKIEYYSNYIPYTTPTIVATSTTVKRNGQLSGKALLNLVGTYYSGTIGSITNSIVIQYRFWEKDTTEPSSWNVIPSASITINNNNITVSDYEIGSNDTTASNYFNPEKAYTVRIRIMDAFRDINTGYYKEAKVLKTIPLGEDVWAEYKDRLRVKKIENPGGIYSLGTGNVNTITPTSTLVVKQAHRDNDSGVPNNGVVLEYSRINTYGGQLYMADNSYDGLWYNGWNNGVRGTWRKLQFEPVVLYNNDSGANGTITLSSSAANYSYIEILYKSNDDYCGSVKVASPNGKKVALMSNYTYNTGNTYLKVANKEISGTTISNISQYTYNSVRVNPDLYKEVRDDIYITRVLGYY